MDGDGWFERWSQRTRTPSMRALRASGFFDSYMFVYTDDNIVGYTKGLCDIFKEAEVMSIMDLDKMYEKLSYEEHTFYWYVTPGKSIEDGLVKLKVYDDITRMLKELGGDRKEGVEETEGTIHTEDVVDKDAWSSNSDSSTEFDDDFEEPEYMERFEDKEVEVEGGVIFDEPNTDVEEQNEEPEVNDVDLDDEQKQALRELGRLNRKRKSQRIKLRHNYDFYDGVFEWKEVQLEVGRSV
ncbi:hypothetical protein QYF36_015433 [Acer negundo]|nr:hypothetical protein QYF36_015433 [Acer negundo]